MEQLYLGGIYTQLNCHFIYIRTNYSLTNQYTNFNIIPKVDSLMHLTNKNLDPQHITATHIQ